jgi:hypothetical protein
MTKTLKPLTENTFTADIPSKEDAFRNWTIERFRLVMVNIRELADRQDVIYAQMQEPKV